MSRSLQRGWDYISLDTTGFAQVGNPTYKAKIAVERQVITTFFTESIDLKVPKEFHDKAYFYWALCPHDFGSYYDFQIAYNRDEVDEWELEEPEKFEEFMIWLNYCEDALQENDEILNVLCEQLYQKSITMEIIHKNVDSRNEGLRAV